MTSLIIDTAFETCQIALIRGGELIARDRTTSGGQHDRVLATMTEKIFFDTKTTIKDVEKIIVTTGPGRFTGLRVGIAFARGLVLVNKTPLVGVSTTDAIAYDLNATYPAQKNKVVLVAVKRGETFMESHVPDPSGIVSIPDDALGATLQKLGQKFGQILVGGVLSPAAIQILEGLNIKMASDVTEPSLQAIAALGALKKAENQLDTPVRPYYAA